MLFETLNGTPLQYSCLENPMGGGVWWGAVRGVAELDTTERLSIAWHTGVEGELKAFAWGQNLFLASEGLWSVAQALPANDF